MAIGTQDGVPTVRPDPGGFGPVVSATEVKAMLKDANAKARRETAKWPYEWVNGVDYPKAAERGSVKGQIVLSDPIEPKAKMSNVRVGLAHPAYMPPAVPAGQGRGRGRGRGAATAPAEAAARGRGPATAPAAAAREITPGSCMPLASAARILSWTSLGVPLGAAIA